MWIEKQALYHMVKEVAEQYCITTRVTRYDSVTHLNKFAERGKLAIERGQRPTVLYWGDLDPSGVDMEDASIETLVNELGFDEFDWGRMALTPEQVKHYNLPFDPESGKQSDPRYKKYVEKYGKVFVELDALHPRDLQQIVRDSLENYLDMDDFKEQKEVEEGELKKVKEVKADIVKLLKKKDILGTHNK